MWLRVSHVPKIRCHGRRPYLRRKDTAGRVRLFLVCSPEERRIGSTAPYKATFSPLAKALWVRTKSLTRLSTFCWVKHIWQTLAVDTHRPSERQKGHWNSLIRQFDCSDALHCHRLRVTSALTIGRRFHHQPLTSHRLLST